MYMHEVRHGFDITSTYSWKQVKLFKTCMFRLNMITIKGSTSYKRFEHVRIQVIQRHVIRSLKHLQTHKQRQTQGHTCTQRFNKTWMNDMWIMDQWKNKHTKVHGILTKFKAHKHVKIH